MMTDSAEADDQRRERPAVEGGLDQGPLADVAEDEEDRHHDHERRASGGQAEQRDHATIASVGGDDGQVAVGEVDRAHDAEQQRQAAGRRARTGRRGGRPG